MSTNENPNTKNNKKKKDKIQYYTPKEPDREGAAKFSFSRRPGENIKEQPIQEQKLKKWQIGKKSKSYAKTKFHTQKIKAQEEVIEKVAEKSARNEFLCAEEEGFLTGENTHRITQHDIKAEADEGTLQKIFDLRLNQFGPYKVDYTRNGRHLLLGGAKGHIAAFDWLSKKLHCELNVMETVNDVKWLHQETMFAVAQKKWTYCYDNQGIEIHCLKHLDSVLRLEFLPHHFLLCSASSKGYLSYLDSSIGKEVSGIMTKQGRLDIMASNPQSAVIHLGHPNGTVTMWTPNMKEPAGKILCHSSVLRDISIDATGRFMATTGLDRRLKVFDLRMYRELSAYRYAKKHCPGLVDFSQTGVLAVSRDNVVEMYKDMARLTTTSRPEVPYLFHRADRLVSSVKFCPYEDVLGLGHSLGFTSIVVPGAGEPNFDAFEANPFQTKSQRNQTEVRMLLDKVHPEMITLDNHIGEVDLKTAQEEQEERNKKKFLKPDKLDFTPRYKMKGKSKAGKLENRKKGVQEENIREKVREIVRTKQAEAKQKKTMKGKESALNRLKKKEA